MLQLAKQHANILYSSKSLGDMPRTFQSQWQDQSSRMLRFDADLTAYLSIFAGRAALTMFRVSTGDDWVYIMQQCGIRPPACTVSVRHFLPLA